MIFELITGDYLFDPQSNKRYTKDEDHIAQMMELVGMFPRNWIKNGKYAGAIFTRRGELRHIHKLKAWPLKEVLFEKYRVEESEAEVLSDFLGRMLRAVPERRETAEELLKHAWLEGV